MAVEHANRILDWQENLAGDEMPPEWMWPFEDELEGWFEDVEQQRKAKYGGGGGASDSDDGQMLKNDYARGRR